MADFVRLEVDGAIGTIRIDRPPMNALNLQLQDELRAAATEAADRADIRAVVIYGGEKVFAAGVDIKELSTASYAEMAVRAPRMQETFSLVAAILKPTVAAVTGYALGGGLELALCADIRVAADDARLGQPEMKLGVIPGAGGTQRLTRLIGASKTKELVYTGRFVEAGEALSIGLVDRVVAPDQVYAVALEWAGQFAEGPAVALRAAKVAIDGGQDVDLAGGLRLESQLFAGLFATEDLRAGMASFLEHGPGKAKFEGR